jgi:hypothetical protein
MEYRKGSGASFGSWVCGSEVSCGTIETGDEMEIEGI